jgi:hypothetical protein
MIDKWIESLRGGQCIAEHDLKRLCAMVFVCLYECVRDAFEQPLEVLRRASQRPASMKERKVYIRTQMGAGFGAALL